MEDLNPYQPPAASLREPSSAGTVPGARLFKVAGIGLATFIGTVLAGGVLIAINYRAVDRPALARRVLWGSLAVIALVIASSIFLPGGWVMDLGVLALQVVSMMALARWQRGTIAALLPDDHEPRSNWMAFGISLLVLMGLFGSLLLLMFLAIATGVLPSFLDD